MMNDNKVSVGGVSPVLAREIENMLRRCGKLDAYDYYRRPNRDDRDEVYGITDFMIDDIKKVGSNKYQARMIFVWSDTASLGNEDNCERAGAFLARKLGEQKIFKGKATIEGVDSGSAWCKYNGTDGYSLKTYDLAPITGGKTPLDDDVDNTWPIPYLIFEITFDDDAEEVEPDDEVPVDYAAYLRK